MISFGAKLKPLCATTEQILKSEAVGFLFSSAVKRTLCTTSLKLFHDQNGDSHGVQKHSENVPTNFGKIVELDEDFSQLEARDELFNERVKSRDKTEHESQKSANGNYAVHMEDESIDMDELPQKNEAHERRTYQFMYKNTALLSSIMMKMKSKKLKEQNQEIVVEGKRLIYSAISAGLKPKKIFFCRSIDLNYLNLPEGTEIYRIPYKACELWGDVTSPQGIIGIFNIPKPDTFKWKPSSVPLTVICDNVRDPGNLGSIIRIVASVGCEKLILTTGCAAAWEQKVLRAAAGAHFVYPILRNCVWEEIENVIGENYKVFLADGNRIIEDEPLEGFSNKFKTITDVSKDIDITTYCSVAFENRSTAIVIGGETHGLSPEAYQFAKRRNGTRLFIPMENNTESLNNSVVLAILAYEFKRQMSCIRQKECSVVDSVMETS